jgi:DNA-binding IclR family transcriptional regulator
MQHGHVKSAARVFAILEYFAEHREPVRLSDLSERLGYPASSTTAILRTMVSLGYVDLDQRTHRYFPSPRLTRLTNWIESGGYEQTKVLDAMYRLRDRAREPVVLATQNGIYIEYVTSLHRYEGTNSHIEPGARRLIVQNGIGWLLLSRQPVAEALRVYRETVRAGLLDAAAYPEEAFRRTLDAHRATEISTLHARDLLEKTAHWDASMISTLLPVPDGHHRNLGLGLHGPTRRIVQREGELADMLRGTVRDLHAELDQSRG